MTAVPRNTPKFLKHLWKMLNDKSNDVCHFDPSTPHAFAITNEQKFTHSTLPKYFKTNHINQFLKQLSSYGFQRLTGELRFRHELLDPSRPENLAMMQKVKYSSSTEPRTLRAVQNGERNKKPASDKGEFHKGEFHSVRRPTATDNHFTSQRVPDPRNLTSMQQPCDIPALRTCDGERVLRTSPAPEPEMQHNNNAARTLQSRVTDLENIVMLLLRHILKGNANLANLSDLLKLPTSSLPDFLRKHLSIVQNENSEPRNEALYNRTSQPLHNVESAQMNANPSYGAMVKVHKKKKTVKMLRKPETDNYGSKYSYNNIQSEFLTNQTYNDDQFSIPGGSQQKTGWLPQGQDDHNQHSTPASMYKDNKRANEGYGFEPCSKRRKIDQVDTFHQRNNNVLFPATFHQRNNLVLFPDTFHQHNGLTVNTGQYNNQFGVDEVEDNFDSITDIENTRYRQETLVFKMEPSPSFQKSFSEADYEQIQNQIREEAAKRQMFPHTSQFNDYASKTSGFSTSEIDLKIDLPHGN